MAFGAVVLCGLFGWRCILTFLQFAVMYVEHSSWFVGWLFSQATLSLNNDKNSLTGAGQPSEKMSLEMVCTPYNIFSMWFRILLLLVFVVSIFWLPYFVDVVSRHYGFLRWSLKIQQLQIPPRSVGAQTSNDQHPRQMQELLILRGFFVLFPLIVFVFMQINKAFY